MYCLHHLLPQFCNWSYRSVPGKRPWALKHNSRFRPAWALTQDINSICLYGSCNSDPLKFGTWALTREWALAQDTTVVHALYLIMFLSAMIKQFLTDVVWGKRDYLIIDTPPGTSDEHITVVEQLKAVKPDGAILVSTPQVWNLTSV